MSLSPHPGQPELLMPQAVLQRSAEHLAEKFDGIFSPQTVERVVFESYAALRRTAKIHTHLTSLAARFAGERLTALAQAEGVIGKDVPEVLFVCVHNSGRSQMAAALLAHHGAGHVHVRSAGSAPAATIHPVVVEAMAEIGLDLSAEYPKPLTDDVVAAADVVITMGCGDACAVYPGKRYLDWSLPDPQDESLDTVRVIRDDIDARVRALLTELDTSLPDRSPSKGRRTFYDHRLHERPHPTPVLFVCVHNAGRSQMAAGFLTPWPGTASRSAPPAAPPPHRSTRPRSRRWPRSASTSPPRTRRSSPSRRCRPRTW